ncbi:putative macrolide ABC transporter permease protein [Gottschalkia acidurici 9a]|uniref:Macrolide ABC transporter permease protein n=1 Tax=Gottschalkia acidurici (strain ATCC 7906 / DSM 604 / BCRC 14475 / CIP 104303 / KCTC 5404 / NCIMB 10678 / 9a) TaxID=1128398 RepID=K0AU39_GOTA9|nr:ABC transporter permease [Gottschalkia acidurici]AFS77353.1 putative macrolide ABC transporter permease protein [Gottschalkia acidurici 9a]
MNFLECIKVALSSLWGNKMRSFLTMLGIIIGISSVITIVSLGQVSQSQIGSEFEQFGTNTTIIYVGGSDEVREEDFMTVNDMEAIKDKFATEINAISPQLWESGEAVHENEKSSLYLQPVSDEFNKIQSINMIKGRFLLESDVRSGRNVIIIDKKLAEKLYKTTDVLGEKLTVNISGEKKKFTIVGIYENKPGLFESMGGGNRDTTTSYIPYSYMKNLGWDGSMYNLWISVKDNSKIDEVAEKIIDFIEIRHKNADKGVYGSESAKQQLDMVNGVLGIVSTVIGAIAAISLVVGGIGVMNIMLVSVTERTREIGIRKAIGATRKDILVQFLIESVIISGTGGLIGTILGISIQLVITTILGVKPSISISTILIAVGFSSIVGVFFGIYPANKAAKLDPIEALRYE